MLVGRGSECAQIDQLLADARAGRSGSLILRGEAGVGKSALLEYAVERARGARVVRARGVETEFEFAFSGLHELARPLLPLLGELPPVQADALRGVLALTHPQSVGRLYVGAATLSLLAAAANASGLLCVVDDAHWLDRASADALGFAARRLDAEGVVMLFASRGQGAAAAGISCVELAGLAASAVGRLVEQEAETPVAASVAEELAAATGGNPLALVYLARLLTAAQLAGDEQLPHPLPVGPDLEEVFARPAERLSDDARRALVVAATADTRAMRVITRAGGATRAAFEECEDAGLLSLDAGELGFSHPLVRSSVYQQASAAERREAHRALAEAFAADERYAERRAWHAAAATVEPDESVAAELEASASAVHRRRGHLAASAMFERAARLTPAPEDRARRLYLAARSAWLAGKASRAQRLLEDAAPRDPLVRADAAHLNARIALGNGNAASAGAVLVAEAERIESLDRVRAAELYATASGAVAPPERRALAERAVELTSHEGGAADLVAHLALARASGDGDEAARALSRATSLLDGELRRDPELIVATVDALVAVEPVDDRLVRELLADVTDAARGHAVSVLPRALVHLGWLEFGAGRWSNASAEFDEAARLAGEIGQPGRRVAALAGSALLAALQKGTADVDELPREAAARIDGLADLGRGAADAAARHFAVAPAGDGLLRGLPPMELDLVAALVRGSRGAEAAAAADSIAAADPAARWAAALLGDVGAFDAAAEAFATRPFLQARVRLDHGEALRRAGARRQARVQLERALERFDALGAEPWAERAREELRASGATPRRREPATSDELTPRELQVARAVVEEASYKDAAAKLFLSPKTVEYHLRKVYRKLGITSGRQLAQRLADDGPGPKP